MGYRAIVAMGEKNREEYGIPFPKDPIRKHEKVSQLEKDALAFLRESCEDLRFDVKYADLSDRKGKSLKPDQIPYNMEKDIDRLCLENAIHRFMRSGRAEEAFDIYFCYLEMFLGNYCNSKKMIEMLAEFEVNASTLLLKHRDHYSHSVYVFVLGLALYQKSDYVKKTYQTFYGLEDERQAAHHFLQYWGLTSLFHDIGYPFELAFEQVKTYFHGIEGVPFVAYKGLEKYVELSDADREKLSKALKKICSEATINDILSADVAGKLGEAYGKSEEHIRDNILKIKVSDPDKFEGYMDHAYFGSVILFRQLLETIGAKQFTDAYVDAITAILLHNSMYKFQVKGESNTSLSMPIHPLAYILMLCDELQCWDRISYGQNSKQELHAMWCDIKIEKNKIKAMYYFDKALEGKKDSAKGMYQKMSMDGEFVKDIESIVHINANDGTLQLEVTREFAKNNRREKAYLSETSFEHLYNFAVALNDRYNTESMKEPSKKMEEAFEQLSLEYKLSNIMQAKAFAKYLNAVDCFYSDKPVEYELLEKFTDKQMDVIGPLEHERWLKEKESMGWTFGVTYCDEKYLEQLGVTAETFSKKSKELRELTRTHKLMIEDYYALDEKEQDKDTAPMNRMLELIEEYDGLRIYRMG